MPAELLVTALLALSPRQVTAFQSKQNANFTSCYDRLLNLNTTTFNDPNQYNLWNSNHTFYLDARRLLLTVEGCKRLCGDGYELWPVKDTLQRLSLWVLPGVILITHFQFPPLPWYNILAVIVHAIGDPVDSLWNMLIRQETQRRLSRVTKTINFKDPIDRKYIATVWAAFEEVGWQDASGFFRQSLESRGGRLPDEQEMYYIMLASHELSSNRLWSRLMPWVAIITLISALITADIRTMEQTEQHDTRIAIEIAHTIAVVALLFIFVPLVKFSGNIGSFTSTCTAVDVIEKLNCNLQAYSLDRTRRDRKSSTENQLFPPLDLRPDTSWEYLFVTEIPHDAMESRGRPDGVNSSINIQYWQEMASYSGMNSSWRPHKNIRVRASGRSSRLLLAYSIIFVVVGSCAPAIFLSATNHTHIHIIGFGCRSFSWTVILSTWLFSFGFDFALRRLLRNARTLWRCTIGKDSIFALLVVSIILIVQIGFYNTCWCRANAISLHKNAYVDLNPYSDSAWKLAKLLWVFIPSVGLAITGALIFFIGHRGGSVRGPLCKSQEEIRENLVRLATRREELRHLPQNRNEDENGSATVNGGISWSSIASATAESSSTEPSIIHQDRQDRPADPEIEPLLHEAPVRGSEAYEMTETGRDGIEKIVYGG
jgi:hypothetical protein